VAADGAGIIQMHQSDVSESRRIAIEATSELRTQRFLDAYSRILDAAEVNKDLRGNGALRDDLMYVVSTYKNIASLYRIHAAEREVILIEIDPGLKSIVPILKATEYPKDTRDLEVMLADLDKFPVGP
jgi:hypothetical protein